MRMKFLAGLAALVLLAISSATQAFITLDAIVPDSPMEGESVAVRVSAGLCDSIIEAVGYPQITQSGLADTLATSKRRIAPRFVNA